MAEQPTNKPTDLVNWASGGGATRAEPGAPKRDLGWTFGEIVPFDVLNQLQGVLGDFASWCAANSIRTFDNFYEAITGETPAPTDPAPVAVGEVFRFLNLPGPGSFINGANTGIPLQGTEQARRIEHDGARLYVLDTINFELRALPNDVNTITAPPYAALWSAALPPLGVALAMDTDSAIVGLAYSNGGPGTPDTLIYDAVSGAQLFSVDNGVDCDDIFCDTNRGLRRAFYCSRTDIYVWDDVSGQSLWAARAGRVMAITCTADSVIWAEADSGAGANGVTVYSAPKNATLTTVPTTISSNPLAVKSGVVRLINDGANVFILWASNSPAFKPWIQKTPVTGPALNLITGGNPFWAVELENSYAPPSLQASICVDDRYIYVVGDTEVYILDKASGGIVWRFDGLQVGNVTTDGVNLWMTQRLTPTDLLISGTGRLGGLWRRVSNGDAISDGGSYRVPFRKAAIPFNK